MTDGHISVSEWEPGQAIDERHLRQCEDCRRQWEARRFLRFQVENAPAPVLPPFFSSRVAHLAAGEVVTVWALLERTARRLIPVFASLAVIAILGWLILLPGEAEGGDYAELLVTPETRTDLTLDDVLYSLSLPLEEESNLENQ